MKLIIKILLLITCFLYAVDTEAQIGVKRRFSSDFRVGLNSSEMDIESGNINKKPKIGFHIGLSASYKFYDDFQFQSGIYLTKKGMKQKIKNKTLQEGENISTIIRNSTLTIDANYVQIPLMLGWESDNTRSFLLNVNGGVYGAWGFKGDTKEKGTDTEYFGSGAYPESFSDKYGTFSGSNLKKFDYGLIGSVGVVYEIYLFNITYEYGLYNISSVPGGLKNRNLTFAIGFRF